MKSKSEPGSGHADDRQLTIPGSRQRFVWMLVLGSCFLYLGYWALVDQHMWLLGGAAIAFAAFGLVVTLLMMRPGSMRLHLDREGFEVVAMKRRFRYAWSEVEGFRVCSVGGAEVVGIEFNSSCSSQRVGRALAQGLAGVEGAIANIFALGPEQVCATLNEWKARYDRERRSVADSMRTIAARQSDPQIARSMLESADKVENAQRVMQEAHAAIERSIRKIRAFEDDFRRRDDLPRWLVALVLLAFLAFLVFVALKHHV